MKQILYKSICLLIASTLIFQPLSAQQKNFNDASRKKEQVKRAYKKAYAKARKRTIKRRYDIQTKATQEMMDAAEERAEDYNKQNDPKFLERIFKRKRPKSR